jgi:hypothetical protein
MRIWFVLAAICLGLAAPGVALGAGGPVSPVQGEGNGIAVPGSPYRYDAISAGRSTIVQELSRTGPVMSSLRIAGRYGIPGVDYTGSTTGLSADGGTLVMAELFGNHTPRTTRLVVLGAPHLSVVTSCISSTTPRRTSASTRFAPTTSRTTGCLRRRSSTRTSAASR